MTYEYDVSSWIANYVGHGRPLSKRFRWAPRAPLRTNSRPAIVSSYELITNKVRYSSSLHASATSTIDGESTLRTAESRAILRKEPHLLRSREQQLTFLTVGLRDRARFYPRFLQSGSLFSNDLRPSVLPSADAAVCVAMRVIEWIV